MEHDPHQPKAGEEMSGLFDDLRKFWDGYGTPILWVVVIGSFSLLVFNFLNYRSQTAREEAWGDLAGSTAPASFEQVADDHANPTVTQLALLTAADMYLEEAADLEGQAQADKLDEAEALYQRALDEAEHDEFRINALEGLAVVAESQRDTELATTRNQAVIDLAETMPGFESWVARAEARTALLPRLAEPVRFVDDAAGDTETPAEAAEAVEPSEASDESADDGS